MDDQWSAGSTYEAFMGRWSRKLAPGFVTWISAPEGVDWLDVGCGTGALTQAICDLAAPASVVGCDPAAPFVRFAGESIRDRRASFVVAGSDDLPCRRGGYGSIASLLALNFFPDATAAIGEMRSSCTPGGLVSACVWDYAEGIEFLRVFWDVAAQLDPGSRELDEGRRFPVCQPEALSTLFVAAGLSGIRSGAIEITTGFADFEDFWSPLLGGTGPTPAYVESLGAESRRDLAQELERTLPKRSDGSIILEARAWAIQGTVV